MAAIKKLKLINCVARYPALYDFNNHLHSDADITAELWANVASECNLETDIAKKYWKTLRDTYKRKIKDISEGKESAKNWQYFNAMAFLEIKTNCELDLNDHYTDIEKSEYDDIPNSRDTDIEKFISWYEDNKQKMNKLSEEAITTNRPALFNFFFLIYEITTKFPEHIQCEVKTQIYNIISHYEEQLSEQKYTNLEDYNEIKIESVIPTVEESDMSNYIKTEELEQLYQENNVDLYENTLYENLMETEADTQISTSHSEDILEFHQAIGKQYNSPSAEVDNKIEKKRKTIENNVKQKKAKKSHICEICGMVYTEASNFIVHRKRHLGIKPYSCEICGKSFPATNELKRHATTHSNERPYKCTDCNQSFKIIYALNRHRFRHTNNRPHACHLCDKRFFDKKTLRNHMVVHSGERSYVCSTCNLSFKLPKALRQHMELHSDVKKYKCKLCGKAFAQHAGVFSHMKSCRRE